MATLKLQDGTTYSDLSDIARELAPFNVRFQHYEPGTSLLFQDILAEDILSAQHKSEILEFHDTHLEFLKLEGGYLWSDLLVLHPGSPQLYSLMSTYNRYHTHTAPEAYYVLAGEAIFGFMQADGSQVQLLVQSQDYIHIPDGVEHWFSPAASLQFKAVRYFTTVDGWIPQFSGTELYDSLKKRS